MKQIIPVKQGDNITLTVNGLGSSGEGVGNKLLHRLTAADKFAAAIVNQADDITANTAFQKFYCHCASLLSQNKTFIDPETQCP